MEIQTVKEISGERYVLTEVDGKVSYVPKEDRNRHYEAILKWVAKGGVITS